MFSSVGSDCTSQLTFKQLPLLSFGVVAKNSVPNYLKRLCRYLSLFQLHVYWRPVDFTHFSQNEYYRNRLNAEESTAVFSSADVNETDENVKQCHKSH